MTELDRELKKALSRQQPSEDFGARVLAEAARQSDRARTQKRGWAKVIAPFIWSPVMAALMLFATLTVYQKHERTLKGEEAKRQLLTAFRIASAKIHDAQVRVAKIDSEQVVVQ